jgi:hypothetical protein
LRLGAKDLAQPLAIELLRRERLALLRELLLLRLTLQHHALTHVLGDLMIWQWPKRRSSDLELALEVIDARLELSDALIVRGLRWAPPRQRDHRKER